MRYQSIVSVIIISYNRGSLAVDCLKSSEGQTFLAFDIIIVDNGSSDGSVALIESFLQNSRLSSVTTVVRLERNLGFAGGNKEGVKF